MSDSREASEECFCGKDEYYDSMIQCEKCMSWMHYECVMLDNDEVERIETFFCDHCIKEFDLMIEWKGNKPTQSQQLFKRKHYFEISKILERRVRNGEREFKVSWKGFTSAFDTWEPENNLDGCLDTLQKYLSEHNLPLSKITALWRKYESQVEPKELG